MVETEEILKTKTTSIPKFGKVVDVFSLFGLDQFPYTTKISFTPLINYWKDQLSSKHHVKAMLAREIFSILDDNHILYKPIEDRNILHNYTELIEMLTSVFIANANGDLLKRLTGPFNTFSFYHSPAIKKLLQNFSADLVLDKEPEKVKQFLICRAGCMILNKYYKQDLQLNPPYIFSTKDTPTSLERHFRTTINDRFVEPKKTKSLKKLTSHQINQLLSDVSNISLWLKYLPPENFEFHGVVGTSLMEVTESETLSRIRYNLLASDAIISPDKIENLELKLRTFLNHADLRFGIFILDYPPANKPASTYEIGHGFLSDKFPNIYKRKNGHSIYEKACRNQQPFIVEDLQKYPNPTRLEIELLNQGIRSILLTPIFDDHLNIIGMMELGSPRPFALNSFSILKLKELIPMITMAVNRSKAEIDNHIEAIIRERFTAIHPSVEWRFVKDAYEVLHVKDHKDHFVVTEPILFPDVHPLYGQADIVASTKTRNLAVQADLISNLYQIKKFARLALEHVPFPLLEKLISDADHYITLIKRHVTSTNEFQITQFIKKEAHSSFRFLMKKSDALREAFSDYSKQLDPHLGIIYKERKKYDESVNILNKQISDFIEKEQLIAQKTLPHYFEKYQTDGVAYNIYAGQPILEKGKFKTLQLQNLRLWQLMLMCNITRLVSDLKPQLPVPLETAQLILVHSTPLTIQFRMDEKRFDVAGSYNVRYEVTKKRIDKAVIEGTNERLTANGKVAIVYEHEKDKIEYLDYLHFLAKKGFISNKIEDLNLRRLQGVQGLRALRVTVLPRQKAPPEKL